MKVVAFDKTGTLTVGKPEVPTVRLFGEEEKKNAKARRCEGAEIESLRLVDFALNSEIDLLRLAAAVEARSEHPLAKAVVAEAGKRDIVIPEVTHFQSIAGHGVRGTVIDPVYGKVELHIGNPRYFATYDVDGHLSAVTAIVNELEEEGQTSVIVAISGGQPSAASGQLSAIHFLGVIGLADAIRPDAPAVVRELKPVSYTHLPTTATANRRPGCWASNWVCPRMIIR